MTSIEKFVFEQTTQIVVSKVSDTNMAPNKSGGQSVGEFFEEIYKKLLEIADEKTD